MTIDEARSTLGVDEEMPDVDIEILYKLKLIKLINAKGQKRLKKQKRDALILTLLSLKKRCALYVKSGKI